MLIGSAKVLNMDIDRNAIAKYLELFVVKNSEGKLYAFRNSPSFPDSEPHVVHSYCAIAICKMLALDIIDNIDKTAA